MLYMDIMLLRSRISNMLAGFVVRQEYTAHLPAGDTLEQEIYRLEQSLAEMATRPSRVIRQPKPLTEQQKIIDLAG
jgi:hypothetical protein